MEKLWSPWRSNYIDSFKSRTGDEECVFCNAESADIEAEDSLIVFKGKLCYVMLNLYPYNNGHLMIIPYRHLSDYNSLSTEEKNEIMELQGLMINALTEVMSPQGFNLGTNIGKAAGAGIDQHLHFHVLPRWMGDTNFMPALGEVKVISQDLLATKRNLREALVKLKQ